MEAKSLMDTLSLAAGIMLPLWNIPLIYRIIKRRSSADISIAWVLGVWFCLLAMFPAGIKSEDIVFKSFSIVNFIFFSGVAATTIAFHNKQRS